MFKALLILTILWGLISSKAFPQTLVVPDSILKTLRKEHPRILATSNDFEHIRQKIKNDPDFNQRYQKLVEEGEKILLSPVSTYVIPDGLRLLATSRKVKNNILTLGFLYQMSGDKKYAERAWKELDAVSKFMDWNPKHFLDVGEMTFGFAIGYDWMYDYWTPEQRTQIRNAIVEHGLNRALSAYKGLAIERMGWWIKAEHNWNQVCNGGIGMLMEKLSQAGLAESTLIIFVGDNGPPFARGKGSNYEAGLKVPLIVHWPGISPKKNTSTALVSCIDIMSSVLEAAGVSPIKTLPGNSLSSLLKNKDSKWRKTVMC